MNLKQSLRILLFVVVAILIVVGVYTMTRHAIENSTPRKPSAVKGVPAPTPNTSQTEADNPSTDVKMLPGPGKFYHRGSVLMQNPMLTPGVVRPDATEDSVCNGGSTSQYRNTTASMKRKVYEMYETVPHSGVCANTTRTTRSGREITEACEVDHLISLELGGADDVANLWPQPYNPPDGLGAHAKDRVENYLHAEVCKGRISLKAAQQLIAGDWYQVYLDNHLGD